MPDALMATKIADFRDFVNNALYALCGLRMYLQHNEKCVLKIAFNFVSNSDACDSFAVKCTRVK